MALDAISILTLLIEHAQPSGLDPAPEFTPEFYAREILATRDEEIRTLEHVLLTPISQVLSAPMDGGSSQNPGRPTRWL